MRNRIVIETPISHYHEHPMLFTLWGADVALDDEHGWQNVLSFVQDTSKEFDLNFGWVKTNFRKFITEWEMDPKIEGTGEDTGMDFNMA